MKAREVIEEVLDAKAMVLALPPPRVERWVFTPEELGRPQQCNANDTFIAYPQSDLDPDSLGVLVKRNGTVTNRWGDGTAGVPAELVELADYEESYHEYDPDGGWAETWRDVEQDARGQFVRFTAG